VSHAAPTTLSLERALGLYGLVFVLMLLLGPVLQSQGLWGIGLSLWLFVAAPTLAMTRAQPDTDVRAALGLRGTLSASAWAGATLVGLTAWLAIIWVILPVQEWLVPTPESFTKALQESLVPAGVPLWETLLVIAVTPAICEELLFRGGLARALEPRAGRWGAILASAALFAALHFSVYRFAATFALGVLLGWVTLTTRSVKPAMWIHGLNNAAVVFVSTFSEDAEKGLQVGVLVPAATVLALVVGLLLIFRSIRK